MSESNICAACSATVAPEEVAQGLAVKVSGRLLCPQCLDRLPGDAQVLVNQMRALRGMSVTTYRYFSGRHPGLPLYTFTTAALILGHRRKLVHGEVFEAPPLPPPGSRPRLPSAAEAARGDRTGWITVAGVAVLVVTGIVWLALPTGRPATPPPPLHPAPVTGPTAPVVPDPAPPRSPASELTELDRRLRANPDDARAVADAAELLRDSLAPREVALRNRADSLVREALAIAEARLPKPEPPKPEPQQILPEPPKPEPPRPEPPKPDLPEPPKPDLPKPEPPKPAPDAMPVKPVDAPVVPPKPVKPTRSQAEACAVAVVWPKGGRPLLEPAGLPRSKDLPWPWPSGVAIHAPAVDAKLKPKRQAIELSLPGVGPDGGATLVLHPGKAERSQLSASWTDGTATTPALTIELSGLRWQAVAIPATGCAALDPAQLRLRLEDARDLGDQRPFLVAGASTRSAGTPLPADLPTGLPILLPPAFETANGWSTFRTALRKLAGKQLEDRQFAFAKAKVLLPFKEQGAKFRTALREDLAALQQRERLPNGNPDDLPATHADFANPLAGWPADGMAELEPTLVFGWRAGAWGGDDELPRRLDNLVWKMLNGDRKLRRPTLVPVLLLGEIDFASAEERAEIERRWLPQALRLAAIGVPVIDLRAAQAADGTEQVQRTAAALLVDGLRQLDWLNKL